MESFSHTSVSPSPHPRLFLSLSLPSSVYPFLLLSVFLFSPLFFSHLFPSSSLSAVLFPTPLLPCGSGCRTQTTHALSPPISGSGLASAPILHRLCLCLCAPYCTGCLLLQESSTPWLDAWFLPKLSPEHHRCCPHGTPSQRAKQKQQKPFSDPSALYLGGLGGSGTHASFSIPDWFSGAASLLPPCFSCPIHDPTLTNLRQA